MATEYLDIVVRQRGAKASAREIDRVSGRSRAAGSSVNFLRNAVVGLTAVLGTRELVRYADTFKEIQNRLGLVTESSKELTEVQGELFDVSNRTRAQVRTTAELYQRLAISTEDLNVSSERLIDITETINKTLAISGASAEAGSAALIQFSQGLAAGVLRGEELNSVLEQAPRLAQALAEGLGVGIGQLRKLGEEGKITAQEVISALEGQADVIAEEFETITPTIGQALTVLQNKFTAFVGQFDAATGASETLVGTIESIGDALPAIGDAALKSFDVMRVSIDGVLSVLTEARGGTEAFARDELPALKFAGAETFDFIVDAIKNIGPNIRTAIRIGVAEFDVLRVQAQILGTDIFLSIKESLQNTLAEVQSFAADAAETLDFTGASTVADFFGFGPDALRGTAESLRIRRDQTAQLRQETLQGLQEELALRRQTADEFIQDTLRERDAAIQASDERIQQYQKERAARLEAAGIDPTGGVLGTGGTGLDSDPNRASGDFSGASTGVFGGDAVTRSDVLAAIRASGTAGSGSTFDERTVSGAAQGRPVQIVLPSGEPVDLQGSPETVDKLVDNLSREAMRGGDRG